MRKVWLTVAFLLCGLIGANAQSLVVQTCGTLPLAYKPGATRNDTVDVNGNKCIGGTISASSSVKATAAAPSYLEGTDNPFSADLNGNLRAVLNAETTKVIGTVNQGTSPWVVSQNANWNVNQGTSPWVTSLTQGGSVLSVTNGIFDNILQGNAVLSATNGLFANQLQGNAVLSNTNPSFTAITDGTNKAAVKAASTAPAATDPAMVVALSSNSNSVGGNVPLNAVTSGQSSIVVQNAAYSAGNSEGGLIVVNAARVAGGGAAINGIRIKSLGGSTNTIWLYGWSKTPTATCTDKAAYVANVADNPYAIPGFPIQVTLGGAPGAWDTATYAQIGPILSNFKNQDSSPGLQAYLCAVTAGSVTPASVSDLSMIVGVQQD